MNAHVQRLIDTAPPLEGQRRLDLTALLLQARAAASRPAQDDASRPVPITGTAA